MLSAILLIGFYLRIGGVFTNSFAYTYDVGRDMLQVSQIVATHKIPLIGQTTGLGGLFYGPWWYYILTPAFIASSGNPQGVAFFMVLVGLAAIVLAFILGRSVAGNRMGLLFATFSAFSPVMVGLSSQIWNPNIAPLFIFLTLLGLTLIKKKSKVSLWHFLVGFFLALLLDTEIVFGVLYIISFVVVYLYIQKKIPVIKNILLLFLGFFIILSPRIFFELRHNFVMIHTLLAPNGVREAIFSTSSIFSAFPDRVSVIFNQYSDTVANGNKPVSSALLLTTIFALIVARKSKNKFLFKYFVSSFIVIFVFLVGTTFFSRAIWGHYLVGLPVFYLLSLVCAAEVFSTRGKQKIIAAILVIVASFFMINPSALIQGIRNPLWEGNAAVYRNQTAVIDYIYKDANDRDFNYIAYTPVVYDYTYQYLFLWYGKKYYGYTPTAHNSKLLYIILEPDPGFEGRIADWLKIRKNDGKVIKEQIVKGGIRVQTRIR